MHYQEQLARELASTSLASSSALRRPLRRLLQAPHGAWAASGQWPVAGTVDAGADAGADAAWHGAPTGWASGCAYSIDFGAPPPLQPYTPED